MRRRTKEFGDRKEGVRSRHLETERDASPFVNIEHAFLGQQAKAENFQSKNETRIDV